MTLTDDRAIERIASGIIDRSLPRADWTHAAHFGAALWLLRHRRHLAGAEEFRSIIRGFNEATGTANTDSSGYHHTITRASVRAADRHLRDHDAAPLHRVLASLMASPLGRSDWPLSYWRRETLFSVGARRDWIEPDLAPLPF